MQQSIVSESPSTVPSKHEASPVSIIIPDHESSQQLPQYNSTFV